MDPDPDFMAELDKNGDKPTGDEPAGPRHYERYTGPRIIFGLHWDGVGWFNGTGYQGWGQALYFSHAEDAEERKDPRYGPQHGRQQQAREQDEVIQIDLEQHPEVRLAIERGTALLLNRRFAIWLTPEDWDGVLTALDESGPQRIHEEITEQAEVQWPDDNEEDDDDI